ncbi:gas vesicle protein [Natrinema sp. 1APR25-10V2]|uniref:gas vesicle protein GvpM n=1 Tax=Natrinema sp. 1APR25-10V2 TaxID=2951081 RepID=UPI0028760708|nr:gas vesicle protein [Natrinema sp. 1APR25-10V2]MDS0474876.1 gas vesicle protein [Natrinema sp. 1APR25-10V2]
MRPRKDDDALVDVLDVLLRDGAILRADVIVSVAEIPLVGIKLTAAIAGMETMTEYGLFEEWDATRRSAAVSRRQYDDPDPTTVPDELTELGVGSSHEDARDRNHTEE